MVVVGHKPAKKRKAGPVPVKRANLKKNTRYLIPSIRNGEWLSDEHIDPAQAMLARQFQNIAGLQAVCIFVPEGCQRVGTPQQSFIQILNIGGNHWVTLSDIGCPKNTIVIYDSLYNDTEGSCKEKLMRQIAYMLMPAKSMTILWADMQKQEGSSDCGLCYCCGNMPV